MAKILVIVPPTEKSDTGASFAEFLRGVGHNPTVKEVVTPEEAQEVYAAVKGPDIDAVTVSNVNVQKIANRSGASSLTSAEFIGELAKLGKPVIVYDYMLNQKPEIKAIAATSNKIKLVDSLEQGADGLERAINHLLSREGAKKL